MHITVLITCEFVQNLGGGGGGGAGIPCFSYGRKQNNPWTCTVKQQDILHAQRTPLQSALGHATLHSKSAWLQPLTHTLHSAQAQLWTLFTCTTSRLLPASAVSRPDKLLIWFHFALHYPSSPYLTNQLFTYDVIWRGSPALLILLPPPPQQPLTIVITLFPYRSVRHSVANISVKL
jgi:hypothetical protein